MKEHIVFHPYLLACLYTSDAPNQFSFIYIIMNELKVNIEVIEQEYVVEWKGKVLVG